MRGGRLRAPVDVDLGHVGPAVEPLGNRLDRWREGPTGGAPRGLEIDQDRTGGPVDVVLERRVIELLRMLGQHGSDPRWGDGAGAPPVAGLLVLLMNATGRPVA